MATDLHDEQQQSVTTLVSGILQTRRNCSSSSLSS